LFLLTINTIDPQCTKQTKPRKKKEKEKATEEAQVKSSDEFELKCQEKKRKNEIKTPRFKERVVGSKNEIHAADWEEITIS
jgi:hypothetical protein